MAFGQPSGPPATAKQVQQLLALLQAAGHSDFRDARGPLGFTQRQAAGKFTRDEADAFIEQLEAEAAGTAGGDTPVAAPPSAPARTNRRSAAGSNAAAGTGASRPAPAAAPATAPDALSNTERALRKLPSTLLAAELQRRGWVVMEP